MNALHWLLSFFREVRVADVASAITPGLRVALRDGRLRLDAPRANYSYGELHRLWLELFSEADLAERPIRRALVLGLGAGGALRLLRRMHPRAELTAVELDPAVVAAARRWFALDRLDVRVIVADAAQAVAQLDGPFDLILVDVFVDDVVPAEAATDAFYAQLRRLAAPGATLLVNRIIDTPAARGATQAARARFERYFPTSVPYRLQGNEVWVVAV